MLQWQRDLRKKPSRFLPRCDHEHLHLPCRPKFHLESIFRTPGAHVTTGPYASLAVSPATSHASAIVACLLLIHLLQYLDTAIRMMIPVMPCVPTQNFRRYLDVLSPTIDHPPHVVARLRPYVAASRQARETSCCSSAGTNCKLRDFYKACTVDAQFTGRYS